MEKGRIKRAAAYQRIGDKANELFVTRDLAALAVAADLGIPVNRYATKEQLASLRASTGGNRQAAFAPAIDAAPAPRSRGPVSKKAISKKPDNSVFVVHGGDAGIRDSMFAFLYSIGLNPIEWTKAIEMTKKGSPHVSTILDMSLAKAQAVVVLLTPDNEARLPP